MTATPPSPIRTVLRIKNTTPQKLNPTPNAFFSVIGSLTTIAAINIVKIGVMAVMMLVSRGVVIVIAFRNAICVRKRPSIEAQNIFI